MKIQWTQLHNKMKEEGLDKYGFYSVDPRSSFTENLSRENARLEKWQDMLYRWDYNTKRRQDFIKKRVRKGIPDGLRGTVWPRLAKAAELKKEYPENYYYSLLENGESPCLGQIMKDINRTFPDHILFRHEEGQEALLRVLKAYSQFDPEVGYCQGMGFILAIFLMYLKEEDAFWMMAAVMGSYGMREFYLPGMPGVYKSFYQVNGLLKHYLPSLWDYLVDLKIYPCMFAPAWLMTLYVNFFKVDTVLRILDVFLNEGPKILFRVYITVFKLLKNKLMTMSCDQILESMRVLANDFETDRFIKKIFKISLSRKRLQQLLNEYETNPNSELINW